MSESFTNSYEDKQGGIATEEQGDSVDSQVDPEREQALRDFERNREQAFSHAFVFDEDIRNLEAEVAAYEDGMDKDPEKKKRYEEQVHFLERQREKQQAVARYERMLWGATPEEHLEGKSKLLEDIALIKDPVDVLALFDRWGALPGANTVDRPVINRDAIASFITKIQEGNDVPDLDARAQKLFPNKRLREKVLQFVKRDPEVEARIAEAEVPFRYAPDVYDEEGESEEDGVILEPTVPYEAGVSGVWDGEDEGAPLPSDVEIDRVKNIQAWEKSQAIEQESPQEINTETVDAEKEIRELKGREQALLEAQTIIDSPMFKYAPFLMRFTKSGRENLAKVRSAGFTLSTAGASPETLEMARALKLKSIRERLAQLSGGTQAFAHDLPKREQSVRDASEIDYRRTNETHRERAVDTANLKSGDTRRENVKRIKRVMSSIGGDEQEEPSKKVHFEKDDGVTLGTDHTFKVDRFNAPIARRRRGAKVSAAPGAVEVATAQPEIQNEGVATPVESQEEKVTRKALEVFNRKKAQKEALAKKVADVTGKSNLSKKDVRGEAVKMRRKKKAEEKTNN